MESRSRGVKRSSLHHLQVQHEQPSHSRLLKSKPSDSHTSIERRHHTNKRRVPLYDSHHPSSIRTSDGRPTDHGRLSTVGTAPVEGVAERAATPSNALTLGRQERDAKEIERRLRRDDQRSVMNGSDACSRNERQRKRRKRHEVPIGTVEQQEVTSSSQANQERKRHSDKASPLNDSTASYSKSNEETQRDKAVETPTAVLMSPPPDLMPPPRQLIRRELKKDYRKIDERKLDERKMGDKKVGDKKIGDKRIGDKRIGDKRIEDKRTEDRRIEDRRIEDGRIEDGRIEDTQDGFREHQSARQHDSRQMNSVFLAANNKNDKENRHDSTTDRRLPVRLFQRNAELELNHHWDSHQVIREPHPSQHATTIIDHSRLPPALTFISKPFNPALPGPPDPVNPPLTTEQLRAIILIGLLNSQSSAPMGATNPDVPIQQQRLTLTCPIHSIIVTKLLKEFYVNHRQVPKLALRCLSNDLVSTQLRYLSLDHSDPIVGLVSSPVKIECIPGGGIIVDAFDFARADLLLRSSLRREHPFSVRSLFNRRLPGRIPPNYELDSRSDYLYGFYHECEDLVFREIDDGLPKPAIPKSFSPVAVSQQPKQRSAFMGGLQTQGSPSSGSSSSSPSFPPLLVDGIDCMQHPTVSLLAAQRRTMIVQPITRAPLTLKSRTSAPTSRLFKIGATLASNIEDILNVPSAKEKQILDSNAELRDLLTVPTAKHSITTRSFQSRGGSKVQQICPQGTRQDCLDDAIETYNQLKNSNPHIPLPKVCSKIHFRRIVFPHTDLSLGDCSYLDTCRHMTSCRFVHYEVDLDIGTEQQKTELLERIEDSTTTLIGTVSSTQLEERPAQWITTDIRKMDFSIFRGKVKILMADPPWDIHMDLPYGTMTDKEMKALRLDQIQDEGLLFLWVTGRAMELGRECMQLWGYKRVEEMVWVKTNQLHRVIRTGRTGHWLNHSKEHCLVGIKGDPKLNRHLDTDLIVAEVRETSRKPDEIYRIIERLCPGPYKLELFGRPHNARNNWITLGNQLDGIRLHDPQLIQRYNEYATKCNIPVYDPKDGH